MQPGDDRRPDLLAGLRSEIASTKADSPSLEEVTATPPEDDRRPELLAGLRKEIASTKKAEPPPPLALLAQLRADIVSTRDEEISAEPVEEFYVEDGWEPERGVLDFDNRCTELDPALGPKMRRRAWEEY